MNRGIWTIIFSIFCCHLRHVNGSWELTKVMDKLFQNYDKRVRPFHNEKPLEVSMSAYILDVFGIDEMRHEFSATMYLRHHWNDERLMYEHEDGVDRVLLDEDHAKNVWIPDTFILNQRSTINADPFPEATIIFPDGSVLRSTRVTTTATCRMDLSYFPFDEQTCSIHFESYGHSASDFYYKWKKDSVNYVGVADQHTNTRFKVANVVAKELITTIHESNFSRFSIEFTFVRSSSRYIVDIFVPIATLTLVALMTLWMNEKKTRIQVSCLVLATMTIFTAISLANFPKVSYQTSMDAYIFFCCITTFVVVITNFAMVQTTYNTEKQNECVELNRIQSDIGGSIGQFREDDFKVGRPTFVTKSQDFVYIGFTKLRLILPIIFISFNFAFWIAILVGGSHSTVRELMSQEEDLYDDQ